MKVNLYPEGEDVQPISSTGGVARAETTLESPGGTYMAMLLDGDDSFDLVVQYPDGERECVWSLVK